MGLFGDSLRFAFGLKPRWASELPPHLLPTREQVGQLEVLRVEMGLRHEEFLVHITGHPETTRRGQRHIFKEIARQNHTRSEREHLKLLVVSRWRTALKQGGDLFGLSAVTDEEELHCRIDGIVDLHPDCESLIDAMMRDEEHGLCRISPAPMLEDAASRVTAILRDQEGHGEVRLAPSGGQPPSRSERHRVTTEELGAVLASGAAWDAFFGAEPLLRVLLENDSSMKDTKRLRLEVLALSLLPLERAATQRFRTQGEMIRSAAVAAAESGLRGMFVSGTGPPAGEMAKVIADRLDGYALTLGPVPTQADWQRMAFEASGLVGGQVIPNPKLAMILGIRFASAMKHAPGTVANYEIVST